MLTINNSPTHVVYVSVNAAFCFFPLVVYTGRGHAAKQSFGFPPTWGPADRFGNRPTLHQKVDGSVEYPPSDVSRYTAHMLDRTYYYHRVRYGDFQFYTDNASAIGLGSVQYSPPDIDYSPKELYGNYAVAIGAAALGSVEVTVTVPGFFWQWPGWKDWKTRPFTRKLTFPLDGRLHSITFEYPAKNPNGDGVGPAKNITVSFWSRYVTTSGRQLAENQWQLSSPTRPPWVLVSQFLLVAHAEALVYYRLIPEALSKMKLVNINSLAYLQDVAGLVTQYRRVKKELKRLIHKPNKKAIANLWLNARYGLPLFVQDSMSIIRAMKRRRKVQPIQKYSASIKTDLVTDPYTITGEIHLTVYVQDMTNAEMSFTQSLLNLDLFPTPSNMWDLVPYSFVVDWLVNVGDHLERLDSALMVAKFPILGAVASVKLTTPLSVSDPYSASGQIKTYKRFCLSAMDLTRLPSSIDASVGDGLSLKHGVDSLALVVQRK